MLSNGPTACARTRRRRPTSSARRPTKSGPRACWHECRAYAERFLRLAGGKLGGDLEPLFGEAAGHYCTARKALCEMQNIFIYEYPAPPVGEAGTQRAIRLLRAAKAAELDGLVAIERALAAID